jgi:hypothetical protein
MPSVRTFLKEKSVKHDMVLCFADLVNSLFIFQVPHCLIYHKPTIGLYPSIEHS